MHLFYLLCIERISSFQALIKFKNHLYYEDKEMVEKAEKVGVANPFVATRNYI